MTPEKAFRRPPALAGLLAATLLGLAACEEVEQVVDRYRDLTPHEAYARSLEDAGLGGTALARAWLDAAEAATGSPSPVPVPHREEGYLPPEDPAAVGLRFALERGQVLRVDVALTGGGEAGGLFLDLFRVPDDPTDPLRPVQDVDTAGPGLVYEPWRDGEYVLRLQPELLRGGRYRLTVDVGPSLAFPVDGRGEGAIQSGFGAPRDGGRRDHHGVDIFAPRGTPVLAAAEGVVGRVQETPRGGRVVWLRDGSRSQSLYYAHLDRQLVRDGQRVRVGDTLGLVGNSGNARTTPPHLHFGIYRRGEGPLDPVPFLRRPRRALPALPERTEALGAWLRAGGDRAPLREAPHGEAAVAASLPAATPFRVLAGAGGWYRVRLPDGRTGWLPASRAESLERPVEERVAAASDSVRAAPLPHAPAVEAVAAGTSVTVLGTWEGYLWVRTPAGVRGWLGDA